MNLTKIDSFIKESYLHKKYSSRRILVHGLPPIRHHRLKKANHGLPLSSLKRVPNKH